MVNCQQNSCCFVVDSKRLVMVMDHIFQVDHVTNVVASQIHYHQPSKRIQSRPHISQNICAVINSYVLHSTINWIGHCDKILVSFVVRANFYFWFVCLMSQVHILCKCAFVLGFNFRCFFYCTHVIHVGRYFTFEYVENVMLQ